LQALQVDGKLKIFQAIDLIEFYRKKHYFLTYFLRLFSFPFLYFSQETVFSHVFSLYFKQMKIYDEFFVCYVKSDPKIAGGIPPET